MKDRIKVGDLIQFKDGESVILGKIAGFSADKLLLQGNQYGIHSGDGFKLEDECGYAIPHPVTKDHSWFLMDKVKSVKKIFPVGTEMRWGNSGEVVKILGYSFMNGRVLIEKDGLSAVMNSKLLNHMGKDISSEFTGVNCGWVGLEKLLLLTSTSTTAKERLPKRSDGLEEFLKKIPLGSQVKCPHTGLIGILVGINRSVFFMEKASAFLMYAPDAGRDVSTNPADILHENYRTATVPGRWTSNIELLELPEKCPFEEIDEISWKVQTGKGIVVEHITEQSEMPKEFKGLKENPVSAGIFDAYPCSPTVKSEIDYSYLYRMPEILR
jgi:hypothetical protein